MKVAELRDLSVEDLKNKISSLEENFFRLRCNQAVGQLEDTAVLKSSRRDIAKAKTVLNEKVKSA